MAPSLVDETGVYYECPPDGRCSNCLVGLEHFAVPSHEREAIHRERAGGPRSEDAGSDLPPSQIKVWVCERCDVWFRPETPIRLPFSPKYCTTCNGPISAA
eukprot:10312735-Alexandrium_andersonii.AAC.1